MQRYRTLTLIAFLIISFTSFAQEAEKKIIPPSPTAAALVKAAEAPVNYYSGTVNISIPIYSIDNQNIKVPIALNYNTGGIRVAEIPGWVGSGWSLETGGIISRTVVGLPDDAEQGYLNRLAVVQTANNAAAQNNTIPFDIVEAVEHNLTDIQSDIYTFSIPGYSGKFFFDSEGVPHTMPYQKLKVTYGNSTVNDHGTSYYINQWTLTTPEGLKYIFSNKEWSFSQVSIGTQLTDRYHVSSWYLSSIKSPTGTEINFEYTSPNGKMRYQATNFERQGQLLIYDFIDYLGKVQQYNVVSSGGSWDEVIYLKKITTNNEIINFSTSKRNDLYLSSPPLPFTTQEEQKLDEITITNKTGDLIKNFKLRYLENPTFRLQLSEVADHTTGASETKHTFIYNGSLGVPYTSYNTDHWGYHNNANNGSLTPETHIEAPVFGINDAVVGSADRSADLTSTLKGTLKEIVFPTGGRTIFDYELNDYSSVKGGSPKDVILKHEYSATAEYNMNGVNQQTNIDRQDTVLFTLTQRKRVKIDWEMISDYLEPPCNTTNTHNTFYQYVDPGTYNVLDKFNFYDNYTGSVRWCINRMSFKVTWNDTIAKPTVTAGGLRIKKITRKDNVDSARDIVTTYQYVKESDPLLSSGVVGTEPEYFIYVGNILQNPNAKLQALWYIQSSPIWTQAFTKGLSVGYKTVKESRSDGASSIYSFTTFEESPDLISTYMWPLPNNLGPQSSLDHRRGLLTNTRRYDVFNQLKEQIVSSYTISQFNKSADYSWYISPVNIVTDGGSQAAFDWTNNYQNISEWIYKSSETTTTYNQGNTPITTNIEYFYDNPNHAQRNRLVTTTSDGRVTSNFTSYPEDYAPGNSSLDNMKAAHLISFPVERVSYISSLDTPVIKSGELIEYEENGKGLPAKNYRLNLSFPRSLSAFKFSNQSQGQLPYGTTSSAYAPDPSYEERLSYRYDNLGNPLAITLKAGATTSYQWGYNNQYPVAECRNASETEFHYEGYEESLGTGVTIGLGHTGKKYTTNASVTWTKPNGRNYVISYWYRSGGVWKQTTEQAYTGSSFTLTGGDAYDDIRIYPKDAQLTTYTYDPLVGMTSQTDPKGLTTYYEYDSFQRLINIKDQNGNIIKHNDYHYKGQ
jgi:YD repeat-containing protein